MRLKKNKMGTASNGFSEVRPRSSLLISLTYWSSPTFPSDWSLGNWSVTAIVENLPFCTITTTCNSIFLFSCGAGWHAGRHLQGGQGCSRRAIRPEHLGARQGAAVTQGRARLDDACAPPAALENSTLPKLE